MAYNMKKVKLIRTMDNNKLIICHGGLGHKVQGQI